jgi:hypothetical protein
VWTSRSPAEEFDSLVVDDQARRMLVAEQPATFCDFAVPAPNGGDEDLAIEYSAQAGDTTTPLTKRPLAAGRLRRCPAVTCTCSRGQTTLRAPTDVRDVGPISTIAGHRVGPDFTRRVVPERWNAAATRRSGGSPLAIPQCLGGEPPYFEVDAASNKGRLYRAVVPLGADRRVAGAVTIALHATLANYQSLDADSFAGLLDAWRAKFEQVMLAIEAERESATNVLICRGSRVVVNVCSCRWAVRQTETSMIKTLGEPARRVGSIIRAVTMWRGRCGARRLVIALLCSRPG